MGISKKCECPWFHILPPSHESSVCCGPCLCNRMCVSECPKGFWGDRRRCKRCYSSCESCTGSRSDQCTSCQAGHHLTEGTNTCTAICGDNYYLDLGGTSGLAPASMGFCVFVTFCNYIEQDREYLSGAVYRFLLGTTRVVNNQ